MPKVARELSALAVSRLKAEGRHAVGGAAGLHLRITGTARTWLVRIKIGSKRRDVGLGHYPSVSLADARAAAHRMREQVREGIDPSAERAAARAALAVRQASQRTFAQCCGAFLRSKAAEWRNAKHAAQWASTLETYAYPVIGKIFVSDIGLPQVRQILDPIWSIKTETASRLRGRIEAVLDYATVQGYRSGDNPARWKGHLDKLLPAPSKIAKTKHHRAMPASEVAEFMQSLRQSSAMGTHALRFLILTAARSGEVRGAKWEEIDRENLVWVIPAGRMKAHREHRVPLTKQALDALPAPGTSPYIFASSGKPVSDMTMTSVLRRRGLEYVPHGFRSTFRDWVGERTNYPRELAEAALAHTLQSKVEAAYRRGDALERRRPLMKEWADFCCGNDHEKHPPARGVRE